MQNWNDVMARATNGNPEPERRVSKTEAEWREQLSEEEYRVTRQAGTERAFSSEMCGLFEPGIYACVCCGTELFDANNKFESHSGWPSFTQPLKDNATWIIATVCSVSKTPATSAMRTWVMFSRMVRRRPGCVSA